MNPLANQPAFPTDNEQQTGPNTWHHSGLTKREHFAGLAMQGILSNQELCMKIWHDNMGKNIGSDAIASNAVTMADALLEALSATEGGEKL